MLKKISIALLSIMIIAGIAGGIYYKFFYKKVAGTHDVNSKIIGIPKESVNLPKSSDSLNTPISTDQQKSDNKIESSLSQNPNTTNYNNNSLSPYLSNNLSPSLLKTPTYSDDYWNQKIKQAEEEAAKSHEALQKTEDCLAFKQQKDAAFLPLKQAINDLQIQKINAEDIVNERIKGTSVNEAQRLQLVEAEKQKIQSQIDQFQSEYNRLYTEYGSC